MISFAYMANQWTNNYLLNWELPLRNYVFRVNYLAEASDFLNLDKFLKSCIARG